jgi:hypothetical protein
MASRLAKITFVGFEAARVAGKGEFSPGFADLGIGLNFAILSNKKA